MGLALAHYGLNAALQPGGASQACHGIQVHSVQTVPTDERQGPASPPLCSGSQAGKHVQVCVHGGIRSSTGSVILIIEFMSPATLQCKYFIYLTHLILTRALRGEDRHSSRFATNRSNALGCSEPAQVPLPTAAGAHPKSSTSLPAMPQHVLHFLPSQPF